MTENTQISTQPMRVLFLCTHNSSRSQMAEGLLQACGGVAYTAFSAGTQPRTVHPLAIKAMQEVGIDISDHRSKGIEEFSAQPPMDLVVTVCDDAAESCPFFPNACRQEHWGFPDPAQPLAQKKSVWLCSVRYVMPSTNGSAFSWRKNP